MANAEEAPQVSQTVEEQQEIVTFEHDEAVVSEKLPFETQIPRLPSTQHTDSSMHSVISFLRRPQLLSTFRWTADAARSENIFRPGNPPRAEGLLVPSGMFRNRNMISRKLDGFTSFKATAVIKLQVNAQPFQCGRLLMAAAPMPTLLGNRRSFIFSHVSQTQNLNHVQMDIAKDTEVELRIPFISPYNCYDLVDGKFDWAEVRILVYSPLNSTETTCLQCLVYGHFEDIEMGAPTSGGVRQQSLMPSLSSVDSTKAKESTGKFTGALAQLGSSLVNRGLSIARPLTSSVDSIISAMGWSKPILAKPSRVFLNRPTEGFQYMDGVDHSLMLGISASNAVEPIKGLVGTNIDETSFNTLKRIPQMIGVFTYSNDIITCSSTDRDPVKLWECAISPSCNVPACYYVTPPATGTNVRNPYAFRWKQPTTLNYISSPFLYWKGSLVYTFKFVKTNFHSGRVEISFHPFVNSVDATRMDFVYRTVVDLRNNSEVSITVPYIAAQPYKRVSTFLDPVNPLPPEPGRLKDVVSGMLYVRALTPLICATTIIANRIEVLVEMRAGDDFEVAAPITSKFLPFSFQNPVAVPLSNPKQQMGLPDLRVPSSIGRFYTSRSAVIAAGGIQAVLRNLNKPLIYLDINGDIINTATPTANDWLKITPTFDQTENPGNDNSFNSKYTVICGHNGVSNYSLRQQLIIENPTLQNELYVMLNTVGTVAGGYAYLIDVVGYGLDIEPSTRISASQIPLPIQGGGPGSSVVSIAESQLPLPVHIETPDMLNVHIDESQLPLPIASEGGGGVTDVRIIEQPVTVQTGSLPLQVQLLQEQFPLEVVTQDPVNVNVNNFPTNQTVTIDPATLPLPTTGSGGGPGGTVTINPCQLPLWTSQYNLAPIDPRDTECLPAEAKRPRQQAGEIAMAGITETRTRAMEGWMPPCITGSAQDAHRPCVANLCIGEYFNSFRQYAKRFAFCMVSGLDVTKMFPIQPVELIRPGALYLRPTADATGNNERTQLALYAPNTQAELSGSPLAFVAGMYAFYRGSIRVKAWMDPRENPPNLLSGHLEYSRQTVDSNITNDTIENFMTPIAYETPGTKSIPEFQVPYYSPTIVSSTWSHGVDNQFDIPLANLVLSIPDLKDIPKAPTLYPIKIAVAAGDDMDFHQFIGPPPVINLGDMTVNQRILHYPPTGFTPTQKIALDVEANRRVEKPASSFIPVQYTALRVLNNATGGVCPEAPTFSPTPTVVPSVSRSKRETSQDTPEGYDTVDDKQSRSRPCPCTSPHSLSDYEYE